MKKTLTTSLSALFFACLIAGCGGGSSSGSDPAPVTYKISGSVTSGGSGVAGATVTLSGLGAATAFTNSTGNYVFGSLANGNYTLTASKTDYACLPRTSVGTVSGANLSGINFTASASPPVFYVVDDTQLALLDVAQQTVTIIGNTGTYLDDIALDPSGNLFGISGNGLFTIDKTTGAATALGGPLGIVDTTSLVFSNTGTLYTANSSLCTVNPLSGVGATVGHSGDGYQSSGDLVFLGSQLYLTSTHTQASDSLIKLNATTGAGTLVGDIGFPNVYGLATNDDVTLYGFSGTKVIRINPATGAGTLVWDTNGLSGLGTINGAAFK